MKREKINKTIDVLTKISGIAGAISAITIAAVNILKVIYPQPNQNSNPQTPKV